MGFREFAKSQFDIIKDRDPALKNQKEVYLYPYVRALYWYRITHQLYKEGNFYKARKISQKIARKTGIEIHPGAQIGKGLFIGSLEDNIRKYLAIMNNKGEERHALFNRN